MVYLFLDISKKIYKIYKIQNYIYPKIAGKLILYL